MSPHPITHETPPTERQRTVLDFVRGFWAAHGCSPTVREIADGMGIKSTNGVVDHLVGLERRGLVTRIFGSARSIHVVEDVVSQRVEVDGVAYDVEIRRAR